MNSWLYSEASRTVGDCPFHERNEKDLSAIGCGLSTVTIQMSCERNLLSMWIFFNEGKLHEKLYNFVKKL